MKKILWVFAFLLTVSVCFGQLTNQGIDTRFKNVVFVIDSGETDTMLIVNMSGYSEQGWPTLFIKLDSIKTLDAWMSSTSKYPSEWGNLMSFSDSMQCVFNETVAATDAGYFTKPADLAFIRSEALVDTSDRNLGFLPGCDWWKFRISLTSAAGDVIKGVAVLRFK